MLSLSHTPPSGSFLAALLVLSIVASPALPRSPASREYLDAAYATERWIRSSAIRTSDGRVWPVDPNDPKSVSYDLYSGFAGVVLFYLEFYKQRREPIFSFDNALAGASSLAKHMEEQKDSGLYTGLAGTCFVLGEAYRLFPNPGEKADTLRCFQLLRERAIKVGTGVQWNDTTDVISGSAGIGLTLLYAARRLKDRAALDLAVQAGAHLIELGRPENGGLKWAMDPKFPRLMPNFSHGTAGVAYFLATLYQETHQKKFLDAALAGARYLQSIAVTDGGICLIFHNEPFAKDIYYLSWCHGPAGTARLFYRLYQITGDRAWLDWVKKGARGILTSGIPEKQTPGYWNNVSQCCGAAGVIEFFLSLYRLTRDPEYLAFARRIADNMLSRATREGSGASLTLKWIQAEHRLNPDLLIAQTGYMQGASGVAMALLHLDALDHSCRPAITFPDSPF
ncbi:MAG TPA: lanthionine synthetase LanC family protein [Candidatus Acidoferrales bacterium]|nr:lanthionine synthetase LanC family protein [Candidatus Acidoferrales bacterium]